MLKKKFCLIGVDSDFEEFIQQNTKFFLGYFSEKKRSYKSINKSKWLGEHTNKNWMEIKKKYNPSSFIVIDDSNKREELFKKIYKNNCSNLICKNSNIAKSAKNYLMKKKCVIIQDHVKIMPNVKINDGVKIHIGAQIHHDCNIHEFSTIAPKALLLGNVKVERNTFIGANSTIKQNIKIGEGAVVGAGSVVINDIKKFDVVAGVPAKSIKID